jgi:ribosomal-protein-alanine N-acetyltransferase
MEPRDFYKDLPALETPRLVLRKMTLDDVEDVFALASDPEVSRYMEWEAHKTIEGSRRFVQWVLDRYAAGQPAQWAIESKADGRMIGGFVYSVWRPEHRVGGVGYVLGRSYWNQGFMTEALRYMIGFGFEHLDLNRIEAICDVENTASRRVMEKCGMQLDGILRQHLFQKGRFRDSALYSILREEWPAQ